MKRIVLLLLTCYCYINCYSQNELEGFERISIPDGPYNQLFGLNDANGEIILQPKY